MDREIKVPELLAPVGGWKQLVAAVNNGADAVYMGGILFNARMKADNFKDEDMAAAIRYAHERNVKVYITQNTLIKDRELEKALRYVNELYQMGADAIIVQDMGLARLVRKYIPGMAMHLSTQGTVYNKWAVDQVVDFGFTRIVPARELTIEEIKEFTKACHDRNCEVEVFVHGALCMCYSGQCQMSRLIGGGSARSGNRGLCAQPCRLLYKNEKGKQEYLLSPKDICTLTELPALCQAGVNSLKIEGRLKSPEYVAAVTSIYRKYLDLYAEGLAEIDGDGRLVADAKDMDILKQIFNRGGLAPGYLEGNPGKKLLSGESPKNQGIYIGKVLGLAKDGSSKSKDGAARKGAVLVDAELFGELNLGDGIEIRTGKAEEEVTGNVVTYIKELPGGKVRIGDFKGKIKSGQRIHKVTDKELLSNMAKSFAGNNPQEWDKALARKLNVEMELEARIGQKPELLVWEEGQEKPQAVKCQSDHIIEKAVKRPADPARLRTQLAKLGGTPLAVADLEKNISLNIDERIMMPASILNDMRREAVSQLMRNKHKTPKDFLTEEELKKISDSEELGRVEVEDLLDKKLSGQGVPVEDFRGHGIPCIFPISKGKLDNYLEKNFDAISQAAKASGIAVGNLGWMKQFGGAGIKVYGQAGLNVYNCQALKAFEEVGVTVIEGSYELKTSIKGVPLMITEHPMTSRRFKDRKGAEYEVTEAPSGDKYVIYSK